MKDSINSEIKQRLDNSRKNWDRRSKDYTDYAISHLIKNKEDENILPDVITYILNTFDLTSNDTVIDIGCGPGHYDILLSKYVNKVVGTDISPKMIEFAKTLSKEYEANNTEFKVMTLQEDDFEEAHYINNFDLAYATFTPAISNLDDFKLFASLTRKYGFLRGFVYRQNNIRNYVANNILNRPDFWNSNNNLKSYFDYLWNLGYHPSLTYKKDVSEKIYPSIEDAVNEMIMFYGDLLSSNEDALNQLRLYLDSIKNEDGTITSFSNNLVYSLSWEVSN